jgi:hypothetical protein
MSIDSVVKGETEVCQNSKTASLKKYSNMTIWAGFLIAIYPILAPYKLLGLSLTWILGSAFIMCHLLKRVTFPIMTSIKPLAIYTLLSMLFSLNGLLIIRNTSNLINAEIAMAVDFIVYIMLWYYSDIDITMKYAHVFGYICCGFAVVQIIATISGDKVPSGQLPILEVSTGWVTEVWGFRFNSLFSEPSYFAIYLLPLFVYDFLKNNWIGTVVFGLFIVLSSSSLGIISLIVILVLRFVSVDFSLKGRIKFILIFLCVIVLANIVVNYVPIIESFINRSYDKINEIFSRSADGGFMGDVRLGGYFNLFGELPIKEQIFGVGNAQLQNYFAERGVNIYNYSNSFVLSLLNFGLLGFVIFVAFLGNLFCVSCKEKTLLFWVILIITLGVDSLLFSYRYYWLVYFVIFSNKRMEEL